MRGLTKPKPVSRMVSRIRRWPLARQIINCIAGYNRVFPDLMSAQEAVAWYAQPGHESAGNVSYLQTDRATLMLSDYPVLYHLANLPLENLRLFDLAGASGGLFYLYNQFLNFPEDLRWVVSDLPAQMELGREVALQRRESRIQFAADLNGADGADVLLVSGALHYFPFTIEEYLAKMARRPAHVFINRTPLVEQPTAATIQYVRGVMVACQLLNRAEIITGMNRLGYRLIDSWREPERSIRLPYDTAYWVREYSGLYFRAETR